MLDLEVMMVEQFHWTLTEIDEMDMERIFEFTFYFLYRKRSAGSPQRRAMYADEATWL